MESASHSHKLIKDEQEKVLSVIKSCISSAKHSLTLHQLESDYEQIVGSPIPFRKLQHATLASFLQSFPQSFSVKNRGGVLYVESLASKSSIHIQSMVSRQKTSKGKGKLCPSQPMRKPRNSWVPPQQYSVQRLPLLPSPAHPPRHNNFSQPMTFKYSPQTQNFRLSGNLYIPRASATTEKPSFPEKVPLPRPQLDTNNYHLKPNTNSCKTELEQEAKKKGFSNLNFNTITCGKKNSYFISTLNVGDKSFSSYPEEKRTRDEAEEIVSKKALKFVKGLSKPSTFATTQSFEVASKRIKRILMNSQKDGFSWWDDIMKLYEKEFHERVPVDWVKEANHRGVEGISFTQPNETIWILSLTKAVAHNSTTNAKNPVHKEQLQSQLMQPPPLNLPGDKLWNVFISYFKDCSEVWFRLIGEYYSDAYENLVTDMELHHMEKNKVSPVTNLTIDSYYACSHEGSLFRVRLVTIEGDNATVFFVDHGDNETLPISKLFHLEPSFLKLPCQSINSCLAGFECGLSDPNLLSTAQSLALGKTLVAEVLSREDSISVVLYDTSTNEDININEKLLQMLPQVYPVPTFPCEGGVCEVYVTNVTSGGDIYVKIESASYKILESLLITARKRAAEILGDNASLAIDMGKLYLAKFSPDGEWQRAAPRSPNRDPDGKVLLKALDLGIMGRVHSANIVPLENISQMLSKIPAQSLLCRLHGVPSSSGRQWTQKTTERLASLFPREDEPMLLKVIKEERGGQPPFVELFQRVHEKNLLVSINATLDLDAPLFSDEDKNNNHKLDRIESTQKTSLNQPKAKLESSGASVAGRAWVLERLGTPVFPEVNNYFDVFVTYAASPSHFAVQSWKNTLKLDLLMGEMRSFYLNSANLKSLNKIEQGGYYALLHTDDSWYRVRVDQVCNELVSGAFVDFGDCFCSSSDKVQLLWPNFKQLPYQAFKAKMAGILPQNMDWTPEDSCRFRQLVENRSFVSLVTQVIAGDQLNPPTLVLRLIDTKDPNRDVYIEDILINEGRARHHH